MRPKSAPRRSQNNRHLQTGQARYEDRLAKTDPFFSNMFSSRKKKDKSPVSVELQKISNVKMVSNMKQIGVIHAYKPQQLKECLVKNTKSYNHFYDKNGKCSSNEVFFRSVIAHFREWKKELSVRMIEVFDIIVTVDELAEN